MRYKFSVEIRQNLLFVYLRIKEKYIGKSNQYKSDSTINKLRPAFLFFLLISIVIDSFGVYIHFNKIYPGALPGSELILYFIEIT